MKLNEEELRAFSSRHGLNFERECRDCSQIVKHRALEARKTKDHAIVTYEPCPGRDSGAQVYKPLSAKEKAHWQDLYWGIRGHLEGYGPPLKPPVLSKLDPDKVVYLGEDTPFAVVYRGICSFNSLLAVANDGWDPDPFCEEACRYVMAIDQVDGSWRLNIDPATPGAKMVTVAYWEEPWRPQEAP